MNALQRRLIGDRAWDAAVDLHPDGWFWHTSRWLDYCLAYCPGATDHSFVVIEDGDPVALVPLVKEGEAFTMGGHPGACPLVFRDSAWPIVERLVSMTGTLLKVGRWAVRWQPRPIPPPTPPGSQWRNISWPSFVVDLRQDEDALRAGLRKGNRQQVRQLEGSHLLCERADAEAVMVAHRLHRESAGRETRPQRTWDLMAEWAMDGYLLTALGCQRHVEADGPWRGMAMVVRYKQEAYYASGATLDRGLSVGLIWRLMLALKAGGTEAFEVGWGPRPGDTDKERAISVFKAGFGGRALMVPAWEMSL